MKTIKELEVEKKLKQANASKGESWYDEDIQIKALKDVMKLIDELSCIYKGKVILDAEELKARIDGKRNMEDKIPKEDNCLNCKHSFRDGNKILRCKLGHGTLVSYGRKCFVKKEKK